MPLRIPSTAIGAFLCLLSVASTRAADSTSWMRDVADAWVASPAGQVRASILFGEPGYGNIGLPGIAKSTETARRSRLLKTHGADQWTGSDKLQHFAFSLLATLSTQYVLVSKANWSEWRSLPASIFAAAGAGVGKELYDWRVGLSRHFCGKDLVANAIGIGTAVTIIAL